MSFMTVVTVRYSGGDPTVLQLEVRQVGVGRHGRLALSVGLDGRVDGLNRLQQLEKFND